ncbi:YbjN domain-containing protein [Rubinisphaera brasiliensis]|uniref:Sensory transduction regulator n=1 Tax=Rubinisphaera brasiliensis (strain ATCC 49424 / DSM 5305 / JCM 21570 / IAM 15109 / NBRC 103401 / IFAM 1448) TaxID=756272 RepID=F0SR59_RUBBR|nr:YbjN domain-containing protein [Rubinisphaera brasiliensis]ADY61306.1 protein of unknown function DUF1790 [Rubinisphaera brasiliensis DSM 5305]
MSDIVDQFKGYLSREELKHSVVGDGSIFDMNFSGKQANYRSIVVLSDEHELQVLAFAPFQVPEGSRPAVALAIAKANYGLKIGNFELDLRDGELRYHASLPFEGSLPADAVLDRVIYVPLAMLDRYLPAFLAVIYGNEPALEAVALVEAS